MAGQGSGLPPSSCPWHSGVACWLAVQWPTSTATPMPTATASPCSATRQPARMPCATGAPRQQQLHPQCQQQPRWSMPQSTAPPRPTPQQLPPAWCSVPAQTHATPSATGPPTSTTQQQPRLSALGCGGPALGRRTWLLSATSLAAAAMQQQQQRLSTRWVGWVAVGAS
jgi:hypothetical protein